MPVNIHAAEHPLSKVFSNDFAFSIPPYQRPYAWTSDQAAELLSDVFSFMGNGREFVSELNPYFLGSIVLIKKEDEPKADVVDGQQRLTTLTILLASLRQHTSQQYAKGITKYLYEEGDLIEGKPNRYRLKLRERDEQFFRKYVQEAGGLDQLQKLNSEQLKTDSQKNIQSNASYYLKQLPQIPEEQRVRLLQYLMTRCFLVMVTTPDLSSAYRIFSILNARGLDLGLTDILKSEIIGVVPVAEQEAYTNIWEDKEEELGREDFNELFAHIRMIYRKAKLRESALDEYRKYIKPESKPKDFIDNVLSPYADVFDTIKQASYKSDKLAENINYLFECLNQIDNSDWLPPAIVYLSQHLHEPEKLVQFFTDLERLAAGLMISRADINYRLDRYGKLLTSIEQNAVLDAPSSQLQLTDNEKLEIIRKLDGDLYSLPKVPKYVLLRLDSVLSEGGVSHDHSVVSVEHVLPQNPKKDSVWLKWFPDPKQREAYTHRLGNLVLLSRRKNSQASNYDFDDKKKKYFSTSKGVALFALTIQVLQKSEWTPNIIEQRQHELLAKLKTVWRLS